MKLINASLHYHPHMTGHNHGVVDVATHSNFCMPSETWILESHATSFLRNSKNEFIRLRNLNFSGSHFSHGSLLQVALFAPPQFEPMSHSSNPTILLDRPRKDSLMPHLFHKVLAFLIHQNHVFLGNFYSHHQAWLISLSLTCQQPLWLLLTLKSTAFLTMLL